MQLKNNIHVLCVNRKFFQRSLPMETSENELRGLPNFHYSDVLPQINIFRKEKKSICMNRDKNVIL